MRAIACLKRNFIKMPNDEDLIATRQGFCDIARFPKCIGAIDCTHIKLQSPGGPYAETYRNRKGLFSLNVQVVGDSKCSIRNIVTRWPGSSHDSNIFRNSRLRSDFEDGQFEDNLLVGYSDYAIKSYLITSLSNPQTSAENLFNEAQIRTRNPIERLFGIWKRRFPILALGIRLNIEKVEAVIVACAVLHNIAIQMNDGDPISNNDKIEAAIIFTNNVNNGVINRNNNHGLNDNIWHALITQYFANLL
ncbi:putative nuclease HARBI1 [Harmonia axyridis]|uniref:putative nuclease HARBI1 n=1 Tax=Harmonia axyridis TaxID=115357 RepID=UPI001E27823D|nr:putative nuclease HARBI1 [Harmonia axyridis]